jgi:hypothetical protein
LSSVHAGTRRDRAAYALCVCVCVCVCVCLAMLARRTQLMGTAMTAVVGGCREKDADKAKKDQAKWDELLGLEDKEKTAEEVLLLKNAERAAAGLPPIEQMPPPPKSEAEAWSELLALEDAVVARQAAATEAERTGPAEVEEGVAEAVTGVEEGEAEDGSVRVDYGSAARANEDQAGLGVAAIDDLESTETPTSQADR